MPRPAHSESTRRQFLSTTAGAGALLGGGLGFLSGLRPVSAEEAKLPPALVKIGNGIEPTVRLLEDTPRERLLEEVGGRIKGGLGYRELLAALLLAGVRNVQPRPQVGFKFHAVLVINSANLASLASPDSDRWLPLFWAIDRFKSAQAETQKESGWRMAPVDEMKLPPPSKARQAFIAAMDAWDEPAADVAAAALARSVGRNEAFELFVPYGARDFRDIGHKAIYVANSFRTLDTVGWQHAEPVLRSLAYALLKYDGKNPAQADAAPDQPMRSNRELAKKVRADWLDGKPSPEATTQLLATFRSASEEDAAKAVVEALNNGVAPASAWDAILATAGELLMRKTGITTLHSVTSANALRYAYDTSADPETRLLMLLQNASFVSLFRNAAGLGVKTDDIHIDAFEPAGDGKADGLDTIFAAAGKDRLAAARAALAYLNQPSENDARAQDLMHMARRMVFLKGNDAHDYKFSAAVLEDYGHVSAPLRNRYLASGLFYFPGSGTKDNALIGRARAALMS